MKFRIKFQLEHDTLFNYQKLVGIVDIHSIRINSGRFATGSRLVTCRCIIIMPEAGNLEENW